MTLPNFLVIGSGRSGTTSLHHYLGQHPDIYVPAVKEPNFFTFTGREIIADNRIDQWIRQNSITDLAAYEALFDSATSERAIGEVSPQYMYTRRAPERIKALIPQARLIAILRNPVDRAYAAYISRMGSGWETRTDFRSAISEEVRRIRENVRRGSYNYRSSGHYVPHLARYLESFDRDQLGVYLFEEFRRDPDVVLRDIFNFLGVDDGFRPDTRIRHNPTGLIHNPVLRELWRRSDAPRRLVRPLLSKPLRDATFQWLHRNVYKPPIPPDVRRELIDYYRPGIHDLERLLDRDLSFWLE